MITAHARIANPKDIQLEISIELPVEDWRRLMAQISQGGSPSSYPGWKVKDVIEKALSKALEAHEAEIVITGE